MIEVRTNGKITATHEDWQAITFSLYPQADEIRFADGRVLVNAATQPAAWRRSQAAAYTHNRRQEQLAPDYLTTCFSVEELQ